MIRKPLDVDALVAELSPELLPDVVTDIVSIIGYPKTLKMLQVLGGLDFAMPTGEKGGPSATLLINAVGHNEAQLLMQAFGGERLYIPRCISAFVRLNNQEFCRDVSRMVSRGETQKAAIRLYAPQYGFSERWAYTVLSEESKRADMQLSLFDN